MTTATSYEPVRKPQPGFSPKPAARPQGVKMQGTPTPSPSDTPKARLAAKAKQ